MRFLALLCLAGTAWGAQATSNSTSVLTSEYDPQDDDDNQDDSMVQSDSTTETETSSEVAATVRALVVVFRLFSVVCVVVCRDGCDLSAFSVLVTCVGCGTGPVDTPPGSGDRRRTTVPSWWLPADSTQQRGAL